MCRNHCQKLEVAVATVNEAMAVPHGAIVRLTRQQFLLASIGKNCSLTLKKVHYLAVDVMAVIANRGPWRERAKHDFVVFINKSARHILTLATLEISGNVYF